MSAALSTLETAVAAAAPTKSPQAPLTFTADSFRSRPKTKPELDLWTTASRLAQGTLTNYGNVLSITHSQKLQALADVFIAVALGAVRGRFAVSMPTAAGKTQSAVMFIVALQRHSRPESVAVCCERVSQLIEFREDLLKLGVPEEQIGLWYSDSYRMADGTRPSIPSTTTPETKEFLLLTHSRTLGKADLDRMNRYKPTPYVSQERDLWIWDESLLASSHEAFQFEELTQALAWFTSILPRYHVRQNAERPDRTRQDQQHLALLTELHTYLTSACIPLLESEQAHQKSHLPRTLTMPALPESLTAVNAKGTAMWDTALQRLWGRTIRQSRGHVASIRKFAQMLDQPLRVVNLKEAVLVTTAVMLPPQLQRVVVLDASYPIRVLEQLDSGIKAIDGFEGIKDWSDVAVNIEKGLYGREATAENFRTLAPWIVEKVQQYGTDPVLILTFKDHLGDSGSMPTSIYAKKETKVVAGLTQALRDAGVDLSRISFLTFGRETSASSYKHIPHVVFYGVLTRNEVDLTGAILGQAHDLKRVLDTPDIDSARLGEQAHGIYQGLSRGTCRTLINGKAQAMTVDLRHGNPWALWNAMKSVMPGCVPVLPPPPPRAHKEQDARAVLAALAAQKEQVSIKALKTLAHLDHLTTMDYSRAVTHALTLQGSPLLTFELQQVGGWFRRRRSPVRI